MSTIERFKEFLYEMGESPQKCQAMCFLFIGYILLFLVFRVSQQYRVHRLQASGICFRSVLPASSLLYVPLHRPQASSVHPRVYG